MKFWECEDGDTFCLCSLNGSKLVCTLTINDKTVTKEWTWNYKWLKRGDPSKWIIDQKKKSVPNK